MFLVVQWVRGHSLSMPLRHLDKACLLACIAGIECLGRLFKFGSFGDKLSGNILGRRVPPCAVKTCAVRPVFARAVGELQAADPSKCLRAHVAKC